MRVVAKRVSVCSFMVVSERDIHSSRDICQQEYTVIQPAHKIAAGEFTVGMMEMDALLNYNL